MFYLISHNTRFVNKILYFPVFSYVITNTTGYEFSRSYQVRSHSYSAHSLQTMTHCTQSDRSSMSFRTQNSHTKRKQNIHTPPHRTEQGRRCFYFYTLYLPKVCVCACVFKHKHTHTSNTTRVLQNDGHIYFTANSSICHTISGGRN